MTPERWQRLKTIYGECLERNGDQRAAFLSEACAGDADLRAEAEKLLAADARAKSFLSTPVTGSLAEALTARAGERIGPYALVREIGRGGMGVLYLAERVDREFDKKVAIKIVSQGATSERLVERFRNERQILAALVHPNIAALLDGGTTPEGLPFFVMEYVEGEPIDRFCETQQYTPAARLELFLRVCGAVQYAHRNLVVHRDLKPANILVTADGQPKLLDFGIAKLLSPGGEGLQETAPEQRFLTPAFASPEQVLGRPVTTLSDVYSLGVLLYLLLTGRRPHADTEEAFPALAHAIATAEPRPPSAVAPDRIRGRLRGDLDAIVLKALRKEPESRYESVEQLGEDIRRFLGGMPVLARRGGRAYRVGKFLSKHRAGVAISVLVTTTLVAAFVETLRERARAERRFTDVRKLAESFLFEFNDAIEELPGSTKARELVVTRAQQYLDGLAHDASGDLSLQAELATAYEKLAQIEAEPSASLGNGSAGIANLQKAITLREPAAAMRPLDAHAVTALATDLGRLGFWRARRNEREAGLRDIRRALDLIEPLNARSSDDGTTKSLAITYDCLAGVLADLGDYSGALEYRRRELRLFEKLALADPKNLNSQRNVAIGLKYLGGVLDKLDRRSESTEILRRAVSIDSARVEADPNNGLAKTDLGISYGALAEHLSALHQVDEALALDQKAYDLQASMARLDPANVPARRGAADASRQLGKDSLATGRFEEGYASLVRASAAFEELASVDPVSPHYSSLLGQTYAELGDAEASRGSDQRLTKGAAAAAWRTAREWFQKSEKVRTALLEHHAAVADYDAIDGEHNAQQIAACDAALRGAGPAVPAP
jgi:tetratricopeptide (TPR) repeat protein